MQTPRDAPPRHRPVLCLATPLLLGLCFSVTDGLKGCVRVSLHTHADTSAERPFPNCSPWFVGLRGPVSLPFRALGPVLAPLGWGWVLLPLT